MRASLSLLRFWYFSPQIRFFGYAYKVVVGSIPIRSYYVLCSDYNFYDNAPFFAEFEYQHQILYVLEVSALWIFQKNYKCGPFWPTNSWCNQIIFQKIANSQLKGPPQFVDLPSLNFGSTATWNSDTKFLVKFCNNRQI